MKKVLITGGNGLIGSYLIPQLQSEGIPVSVLSRADQSRLTGFKWNIDAGEIDLSALEDTGTIIHLAGAGIAASRWTAANKKEIIDSRVKSAELLLKSLKSVKHDVTTFISASGIGYYGDCDNTWVEEDYRSKEDFTGLVCTEWEKAAKKFEDIGIRVVIFRIGIVLAKNGGALPSIATPVKLFAGAPLGSGNQYMSWIHIDDLCRMFLFAISNLKLHGTFNAVAPGPVTNREFVKGIAKVLHRPVWPFSIPSFLLKLILGEKAAIVLSGQRASSEKIRMAGFNYLHSDLSKSLQQLL